jgi:hypothetical protein
LGPPVRRWPFFRHGGVSRRQLPPQPDSRPSIITELHACLFEGPYNAIQCLRSRIDRVVESFHSAHGPKRDLGLHRQFGLRPSQQCASRTNVPARYDDQAKSYHGGADKLN